MRSNLIKMLMNETASRTYDDEYIVTSKEEADFCLNHCPHKSCKGDCAEFREFKKNFDKRKNGEVNNAVRREK